MWLPFRKDHEEEERRKQERLREIERQAEQIKERGYDVAQYLEARYFRNHWGEAVAEIARREKNNARQRRA